MVVVEGTTYLDAWEGSLLVERLKVDKAPLKALGSDLKGCIMGLLEAIESD